MADLWSVCPACGSPAYEMQMGHKGPFSMEQTCIACGNIGPDLHFTAEPEPETEVKAA